MLHLRFSCNLFSQCRVDKYFVQMARLLAHLSTYSPYSRQSEWRPCEAEAKSRATRSPKTEPNAARLFLQLVVRWMGQHCIHGDGCVRVLQLATAQCPQLNTCRSIINSINHTISQGNHRRWVVSRLRQKKKKLSKNSDACTPAWLWICVLVYYCWLWAAMRSPRYD